MKTLYVIGNRDSEIAKPFRISMKSAVGEAERVWATLSSERLDEFVKDIDAAFAHYALGNGKYDRSADVAIRFILSSAWNDLFRGREFTLEVLDVGQRGFTTTLVRRETPKTPES